MFSCARLAQTSGEILLPDSTTEFAASTTLINANASAGGLTMKISLMVLLMMFNINAYAEVNKWVDENNQVHYSDQPPPSSTKTKKLRTSSGSKGSAETSSAAASNEPAAPKTIAEREAELRKSQQAKKEAADKAAQEQANEEAI